MKRIHSLFIGLTLMAPILFLQSCLSDDDYDDDYLAICPIDQPNALVTVKPNADNTGFIMQLNDSTTLWPVNLRQSPFGTKEVRALVNYRQATPSDIEKGSATSGMPCVFVNWIDSILTKPVVEGMYSAEENLQIYGDDPLEIVDDWTTVAEDGYLTLRFRTRWGGKAEHRVNLVHRTDVNTPYYFTLYHDAQGDTEGQTGDALVAFKLADWMMAPSDQDYATLTLEWKSYSGTKTAQFKFRQNKGNVSSTSEGH